MLVYDNGVEKVVEFVEGVPVTYGTISENLFFRVAHCGIVKDLETNSYNTDTRGLTRYASPKAYFGPKISELEKSIDDRKSKLLSKMKWGDDDDDDESDPRIKHLVAKLRELNQEFFKANTKWQSKRLNALKVLQPEIISDE